MHVRSVHNQGLCDPSQVRNARQFLKSPTRTKLTCMHPPASFQSSDRIQVTDAPIIVKTKRLLAMHPDAVSLAQGIVHWGPPPGALEEASKILSEGSVNISGYGPAEGLPALRDALRKKVASRNGLQQAVLNAIIALTDAKDSVILFKPYYFNHLMAIQMSGGSRSIVYGDCDPTTQRPDLQWLRQRLSPNNASDESNRVKMVVITNPCNPTGVLMPREEIDEAARICEAAGCFLLLDNTYEDFLFGGLQHYCSPLAHVLHIFSMSKAYGMMGWRVGYLAYHNQALGTGGADLPSLADQLLKVQDTTIICPPQLSQHVALAALSQEGTEYVEKQIRGLEGNRALVLDALSPLVSSGQGQVVGGEGAIYIWARLPQGTNDEEVFEWLVKRHGVCVIPGSSCGAPGYIRAAFANLRPQACEVAAARLKRGMSELVHQQGSTSGTGSIIS